MRICRAILSMESPIPRSRTTSSRLKICRGRPIEFPVTEAVGGAALPGHAGV